MEATPEDSHYIKHNTKPICLPTQNVDYSSFVTVTYRFYWDQVKVLLNIVNEVQCRPQKSYSWFAGLLCDINGSTVFQKTIGTCAEASTLTPQDPLKKQ